MSNGVCKLVTTAIIVAVVGCMAEPTPQQTEQLVGDRWYTHEQVSRGKLLYEQHCAVCHGQSGEGLAEDWRKVDANGNYPPPPLNGTAHTWHHPMDVLLGTIESGGELFGGVMPAYGSLLDQDESREIVAYFQSLWSDEIYARWREIDSR